tara:strand:+ start:4719 stop:6239 length:1521 start_codon:yes stop_codon:yes gene_type:complete
MILNRFDGGLSTRLAQNLIFPDESVILENVDISSGHLKPTQDISVAKEVTAHGIYVTIDKKFLGLSKTNTNVFYRERLYVADGVSAPIKFIDDVQSSLGIYKSEDAPTLSSISGALPASTYTYLYTYYNNVIGFESVPSPTTVIVLGGSFAIQLTNITESSDPQVDKIRIYRIGNTISTFSLVATIDNGITTFDDNITDTNIPGDTLSSLTNYPPPNKLNNITQAYGTLFGSLEDKLYYSNVGDPEAWNPLNFIDFEDTITGLLPTSSGIGIFTRNALYSLIGTTASTFKKILLSREQGTRSHRSCKTINGQPIWISNDGICSLNGGRIVVITKEKLGKQNFSIINTAVFDEIYYVLLSDGTVFVADFRYKVRFYTLSFSKPLKDIYNYNDVLWGLVDDSLVYLFEGAIINSFHYKSGLFALNNLANHKMYNRFYIKSTGVVEAKIYVDTGYSVMLATTQTLEGAKVHDITVPTEYQRGYTTQIELSGTGSVEEIEFNAIARSNGQ